MTTIRLTEDDQRLIFEEQGKTQVRCCVEKTTEAPATSLVTFMYLNKGAANVVFKIHPWAHTSSATPILFVDVVFGDNLCYTAASVHGQHLMGHILRVSRGESKHLTSMEIIQGFETAIRPLFLPGTFETIPTDPAPQSPPGTTVTVQVDADLTKHLMDHEGVILLPDVMQHLYTTANFAKPPARECWGILLPDMSPVPGRSVTLEIKPKWLAQSPNAPPKAIRCRTCAMQVFRTKKKDTYICPLQLLHGASLRSWVRTMVLRQVGPRAPGEDRSTIIADNFDAVVSSIVEGLLDYLTAGDGFDLLRHLLKLQKTLDPLGVLNRPQQGPCVKLFDHNLRLAMTLRDCSLFIKVAYNASGVTDITSKLGDLDFKSAEKIADWTEKERQLLVENAYTTTDGPDCWLQQG
ncbi:hypothetical protein BDW02DRAFT_567796 [Decorospora gaudefroyi]|uniref:Inositol-pentakisphosphate 2-kinase n=1 Tax=Decorospora gaudefroyi TaxID=184978 RepID=A0A6A5KHL3_9PLEO|nr:hypothetical protein BDW02DRAFT_567796 [Decorospora gaudefroyi]